jgi:integrase/recombinase XerD
MQTLSELFEKFIKERIYGNGNSPVTIKNYRENFELLKKFKTDIKLEDLTKDMMIDFMEFLDTRERKVGNEMIVRKCEKSTIATRRGKLGAFFNWLVENKYMEANPFDKIHFPDVSHTDKRAFTNQEFEKICNAINTKISWANLLIKKRNIAMVMFFALTGVRKGESLGLKMQDFDMKNKDVVIRGETSKSKRTKILPLNKEIIPYLDDYLTAREDYTTDAFWVSGNKDEPFTEHGLKHLVEKLKKETGIKKFYVHRFRHTFAVNFYTKSNDIHTLMMALGHRSLKMTNSYLRSIPGDYMVEQIRKMSTRDFV